MNKLTPEQQIKCLRTDARKPGAQDFQAQDNRVLVMDALYTLAGRNNKDSPSHGLYTGLNQTPPDNI